MAIVDATTEHGGQWPPEVQQRVVDSINALRRLQGRGEITLLTEVLGSDLFPERVP